MTDHDTPDSTSGSDDRESRQLRDPLMKFGLGREIERLTGERKWVEDGKNSILLAKDARLRVLLTVMRAGERMGDDDSEGPMTVQVVGGRVVARHESHAVDLTDGELGTLAAGGPWSVEAVEDSAVLLTISWPRPDAADA